jgi:hypothetical protein
MADDFAERAPVPSDPEMTQRCGVGAQTKDSTGSALSEGLNGYLLCRTSVPIVCQLSSLGQR